MDSKLNSIIVSCVLYWLLTIRLLYDIKAQKILFLIKHLLFCFNFTFDFISFYFFFILVLITMCFIFFVILHPKLFLSLSAFDIHSSMKEKLSITSNEKQTNAIKIQFDTVEKQWKLWQKFRFIWCHEITLVPLMN